MLGEKVIEGRGKVTGMRVLPGDDYRYHKVEVSFQEAGTILGVPYTDYGTFEFFARIPGQLFGEGRGLWETADGEGAIYSGQGVAGSIGPGLATSWRAAVTVQTNAQRLARLNKVVVLFEFDIDAEGNIQVGGWEWK